MFQLTEAKVNAQLTPDGYEPPAASDILVPWATAAGKKRKRARDTDDGDDSDMGDGGEEPENDDE